MNAWQKSYQGWLSACNGVKVTSTGTFNLVPFEEQCNGVQFLQIQAPKARSFMRPAAGGGGATTENLAYYYVELRTPNDFDGTLGNRTALAPTVLIHVADNLRTRTQAGDYTFLLDMTPTTTGRTGFSDAGLGVGQTFTDPVGGVSIMVQSLSATGATIVVTSNVNSAAPTCLDGTTFAPPGPTVSSCTGGGGAGGTTGAGGAPGAGGAAGGRGGSGGITGAGGATGGRGGGAGVTGAGGAAGAKGGTGGSPTTTGSGGTSGAAGAAGNATGSGGAPAGGAGTPGGGTTGSGGATGAGPAGTTGATSSSSQGGASPILGGGPGQGAEGATGGCACDTGGGAPSPMFAIGLVGVGSGSADAAGDRPVRGIRGARRFRRSSRQRSDRGQVPRPGRSAHRCRRRGSRTAPWPRSA